jgi:hypothetical protein
LRYHYLPLLGWPSSCERRSRQHSKLGGRRGEGWASRIAAPKLASVFAPACWTLRRPPTTIVLRTHEAIDPGDSSNCPRPTDGLRPRRIRIAAGGTRSPRLRRWLARRTFGTGKPSASSCTSTSKISARIRSVDSEGSRLPRSSRLMCVRCRFAAKPSCPESKRGSRSARRCSPNAFGSSARSAS